jgi:serine/threonine protein kinase
VQAEDTVTGDDPTILPTPMPFDLPSRLAEERRVEALRDRLPVVSLDGLFATDLEPVQQPALEGALPDGIFARVPVRAAPRRRSRKRLPEPELPEIGAILDKYRIEDLIGVGGFAVVYRATHLLLNRSVAIKLLRPKQIKRRPNLATLLCNEARFAARIVHPNVVRVYDVTHTPSITYLVMEFIEGQSLSETIKSDGALSPQDVLRVGIAVAEGLQAGLEQGIIHRDIKPANILLARGGDIKIVDLGLAQPSVDDNPVLAERFEEAQIVGTPGYMAPEQSLHPEKVGFRADIYSLGVTLYHAATGVPPFPTGDAQRCLEMHRYDPVPDPETRVPGFPRLLADLLMRMLMKNPADRHESYGVLIKSMTETLSILNAK